MARMKGSGTAAEYQGLYACAAAATVDLLALGWPRDPDRGAVARGVLGRCHVPVLLVPIR